MQYPQNGPGYGQPKVYNLHKKATYGISITIIILGISSIVLQIAGIAVGIGLAESGAGIYCGFWFILNGAFGCSAANNASLCKVVTFLVMSIITAAAFAVTQMTLVAIGLGEDDNEYQYNCRYPNPYPNPWVSCEDAEAGIWLNSIMLGSAIIVGILAIVGSAISCGALCCRGFTAQQPVIQTQVVTASYIPQNNVAPTVTPGYQVPQNNDQASVVLIPSQMYPGHYTIAQGQAPAAQRTVVQIQAPPSYDNFAYASPATVEQPAVHQPSYPRQDDNKELRM